MRITLPLTTRMLRRSVFGALSILVIAPALYFAACSSGGDDGGGGTPRRVPHRRAAAVAPQINLPM